MKITEQQKRLVDFAGIKPRSREELMRFMNRKHRTQFRRKWIDPLLDAGLLVMTIPDKPNSPYQKYKALIVS
jgi:ATP-dependent DNA helicase RecG